jgi:putative oxidoreductase
MHKHFLLNPNLGLLIMRLMIGVVGMFHGAGKLFNIFDGPGLSKFADALKGMNIPVPMLSAVLAGSAECFGGLLIAVGLFTRIAALPFAFNMLVAFFIAHKGVFSIAKGGGEFALTLAVFAIGLFFTGPGQYAISAGLQSGLASRPKSKP